MASHQKGDPDEVVSAKDVALKARVVSKPEPTYTEAARQNQVTGTVVLRAVFAADGTVKHILVIRGLPFGLTEMSIAAARKIKFIPATLNGRPVSTWMQLEYNFNLY
jgi:TonB family protein